MRRGKNRFIERSFLGAVSFFKEAVYNEEYASCGGLLQGLNPSIKVAALIVLILIVAFVKSIPALIALYFLGILLAYLSKINVIYFLKRVWIFIPLFAALIAVPAIFSFFSPGDVIASFNLFSIKLSVTRQGVNGAALFVLRVACSVSFAALIAITTRHTQLLKTIRSLGAPQLFVVTLGMTYRFLFILVKNIEEMFLAVESRAISKIEGKKGRMIVAQRIGMLWEKSRKMSEEVYMAMVSRGYNGEPKSW